VFGVLGLTLGVGGVAKGIVSGTSSAARSLDGSYASTGLSSGVVKPDFYVGENGIAIPSTGYRAIVGEQNVQRAMNGDLMSSNQPFSYFTFDDISNMSGKQVKDLLQLQDVPSHYGSFDTLHQFDNISIPRENWNRGINPEPITKSYPEFGSGGGSQVITNKPIENFELKPLK
jgi:hypothetical protein